GLLGDFKLAALRLGVFAVGLDGAQLVIRLVRLVGTQPRDILPGGRSEGPPAATKKIFDRVLERVNGRGLRGRPGDGGTHEIAPRVGNVGNSYHAGSLRGRGRQGRCRRGGRLQRVNPEGGRVVRVAPVGRPPPSGEEVLHWVRVAVGQLGRRA